MVIDKFDINDTKKIKTPKVKKTVSLNLPLRSFRILARYSVTVSNLIRLNHLSNLKKFLNLLNPQVYINDPNKAHYVAFM
jgi:hypothetical protein